MIGLPLLSASAPPVGSTRQTTSPWQVAYIARIYTAPGDRKVSRPQLYLSDLHGGHVRQVTTGASACRTVRWLDRSTIAWTREDGTLWRLRVDGGRPQLWRRTKAEFAGGSLGQELQRPGRPVFTLDRSYRYIGDALVPVPPPLSAWWVGAAEGCDLLLQADTGGETDLYGDEGRLDLEKLPDQLSHYVTAFIGPQPNDLWVLYGSSLSTWGEYYDLVRYNRKSFNRPDNRIRWALRGIKDLDFRTDRTTYARVGHRALSPYGKGNVWTAPIHVGDWGSGREWKLTRGTVEARSASLRP